MSGPGIVEGRTWRPQDVRASAEVVVVGSGAGGAVVATELAEAGLDVLVLEEGGHTPPDVYGKLKPSESLRALAREAGSTTVIPMGDTPLIGIMTGRTVGGSSTMTGGVCFRIPESVAACWADQHGLSDLAPERMEPHYRRVEEAMHVEEVPVSMRSRSTLLFDMGAATKGFQLKPMRRNTAGCIGLSRCNFGCPVQAKMSVDISYLPRALHHGARIWADCLVERVSVQNGRAAGVVGRVLNGRHREPGSRFEVTAKAVVIAAGALHTPRILRRSGIGRGQVIGQGISLHPSCRVGALFEDPVRGWEGALQSAFSDQYQAEGILLNSVFPPLSIQAATLPGVGAVLINRVHKLGHLAVFGAHIHDEPRCWLIDGPGREPWLLYRMRSRDKQRLLRAIRLMAEIYFAARAKTVFLPIFGAEPIDSPDQLKILDAGVHARRIESVAFHPMGSVPMGTDRRRAVVSPDGEAFALPGVWIADGSILPSDVGVNTQLPIMAMATRIAAIFLDRWRR